MPASRAVILHDGGPVNDMDYRLSFTEGDETFLLFTVYPWGDKKPRNLTGMTNVRFRIEEVEGVPAVSVYPTAIDKYADWPAGIISVPIGPLDLLNRDGTFRTALTYTLDSETLTPGRGLVEVLSQPSFNSGPAPIPGGGELVLGANVVDSVETADYVSTRWDVTITRDDGERGQFTITATHDGLPGAGNANNVFFDVVGGASTSAAVDDVTFSVVLGTGPQTMDLVLDVAAGNWTATFVRTAIPNL